MIRVIYRRARHCTAVSHYLADRLHHLLRVPVPFRIPNVVEGELFYPLPDAQERADNNADNEAAPFRFVHVSTLKYQKNPRQMLEAAALLRRNATRPFELIVFGPADSGICRYARELGLEEIVQFNEEVTQDILSDEMRRCQAMVFCSRYETFGCVIIEAYASGIPVIVSDIPVMREIVEEGKTGILVPPGDPAALAEKMQ